MPRREQQRVVAELLRILGNGAAVLEEVCPTWLMRPGREEAGDAWPTLAAAYTALTGLQLPNVAPPRERRRLDVLLTWGSGREQIVEVDEEQHFTPERFITLDHYPPDTPLGFDIDEWRARCAVPRKPRGGGWGRSCPPLFPGKGGRHRQRAFRDMLADLLSLQYGWLPTVRIDVTRSVISQLSRLVPGG